MTTSLIAEYEGLVQRHPADPYARMQLARLWEKQQRWDRAAEAWLGVLQLLQGIEECRDDYETALTTLDGWVCAGKLAPYDRFPSLALRAELAVASARAEVHLTEHVEALRRKQRAELLKQLLADRRFEADPAEFAEGENLVWDGDSKGEIFLLVEGACDVLVAGTSIWEIQEEPSLRWVDRLGPNEIFGASPLFPASDHFKETVTTRTRCKVLRYRHERFDWRDPATSQIRELFQRNVLWGLGAHPLFAALSPQFRFLLAFSSKPLHLKPKEVLCEQGDSGGSLYLVLDGWVAVHARNSEGVPVTMSRRGRGYVLGEVGAIDAIRSASIVADDELFLAEIPEKAVHQLMRHLPAFKGLLAEQNRFHQALNLEGTRLLYPRPRGEGA